MRPIARLGVPCKFLWQQSARIALPASSPIDMRRSLGDAAPRDRPTGGIGKAQASEKYPCLKPRPSPSTLLKSGWLDFQASPQSGAPQR